MLNQIQMFFFCSGLVGLALLLIIISFSNIRRINKSISNIDRELFHQALHTGYIKIKSGSIDALTERSIISQRGDFCMHDIVKFVIPAGDIVEGEIIGITNFFVLSDNHFIIKPTILGNQIQHVHTKSIVEKMNFRKEKEVPIDPNSTSDPKPELKSEDVDSLPNKNN